MSAIAYPTSVSLVGAMEGLNLSYNDGAHIPYKHVFDSQGNMVSNAWDQFNEVIRHQYGPQADAHVISSEQLQTYEKNIKKILRWKAVSEAAIPTRSVGAGVTKVTANKNKNVPKPRPTKTLDGTRYNVVTWDDADYELIGLDYDLYLDKLTIDAGNNPEGKKVSYAVTPQQNSINAFTESLIESVEWFKWQGYQAPGLNGVPTKYKGIVNTTGITDPGAVGTADSLVAVGDTYDALVTMAGSLMDLKFEPPFDVFMTPKVINNALKSVSTTSDRRISDFQMIRELGDPTSGGKMFNDPKMCPFLLTSETETSGTGAIAVVKSRPDENYIASSYPIGVYPLNVSGLGWAVKMFWYGGSVIDRPEAICFANNLTTST